MATPALAPDLGTLAADIRQLIADARRQAAVQVNAALTTLYWQIGTRVRRDVLNNERAEYGAEIVSALGRQLEAEFGRGYSEKSLRHMLRFAEAFPDAEIVSTLSRELAWSHFKEIVYLEGDLRRDFYAEMCRLERWSVRTLRQKIDGMLYERTMLSQKPDERIRTELDALRTEDRMTTDLLFQDPYLLDFLNLTGAYSEQQLEEALVREVEHFLLELGVGFTFVASPQAPLASIRSASPARTRGTAAHTPHSGCSPAACGSSMRCKRA